MALTIDRKLYLVLELERPEGPLYVHSAPISAPVFRRYYMPMAKAFTSITKHGLGPFAGPRVAAYLLEDAAKQLGDWDDKEEAGVTGVESGLMAEIRRLTSVMRLGPRGWEMIPLDNALLEKVLDEEEAEEVANAIVFFTLGSAMHNRLDREPILSQAALLWGGLITSSDASAYMASLPTSTPGGNTGEKATA